jgi:hypothetical protein
MRRYLKTAGAAFCLSACAPPPDIDPMVDPLPDPAAAASAAPLCDPDFQQSDFQSPEADACSDLLSNVEIEVDQALSDPQSPEICNIASEIVDNIEPLITPVDDCNVCVQPLADTNITVSHCDIDCSQGDPNYNGDSEVQNLCSDQEDGCVTSFEDDSHRFSVVCFEGGSAIDTACFMTSRAAENTEVSVHINFDSDGNVAVFKLGPAGELVPGADAICPDIARRADAVAGVVNVR